MLEPGRTAMVAAHAYDLRAAARVGMRTIYVRRTTEDSNEDMEKVAGEVDLFIDGTAEGGGLLDLARRLGAFRKGDWANAASA